MNTNKIKIFTIPNGITLLNLLSGCISIVYAFYGELTTASILIFIAGFFDFMDGFAARILKSYSDLGKQLDSLADVVSFGIAPSFILFGLYFKSFELNAPDAGFFEASFLQRFILVSSFIIALFSALRLAKFNIDERQSDSFIGVPTPANAFFFASLPFVIQKFDFLSYIILSPYFLISISLVLSFLLISEIPLISLKFKNLNFKENKLKFLLLTASLLLLILLQIAAYPIIFIVYILISIIGNKNSSKAIS
jgi:CDP-diacylglycerol---serine O-phosphatidyltransferase